MLDHPARVDAHVVGHHVRREADAALPGAVAQVRPRALAAQVVRDRVVVEGVRRCRRVRVAAPDLDPLARVRALPEADEPEAGDPQPREPVQLLVGDRVQRPDVAPVPARELVQPDVRALGDEDEARHPGGVAREALGLGLEAGQVRRLAAAATVEPPPPAPPPPNRRWRPRSSSAMTSRVSSIRSRSASSGVAQQLAQRSRHVAQLAGERRRVRAGRGPQQLHERLAVGADGRQRGLVRLQRRDGVVALRLGQGRVVDQHPQRPGGGVLVGDPDEQQLLQADGLGVVLHVRELVADGARGAHPGGARPWRRGSPRPWPTSPSAARAPPPAR